MRSELFIFSNELDALDEHPEIGSKALEEKGKINGRMDSPPADYDGLDLVELQAVKGYEFLVAAHQRGYQVEHATLAAHLAELDQRIFEGGGNSHTTLEPETEQESLPRIQRACSDMDTVVAEESARLLELRQAATEAQQEFNRFRQVHNRTEDIEIPRKKDTGWSWGIVFGIVFFETLINGLFFAMHAGGEYIQWWGQALLISAVNILLFGLLISQCWRYRVHVRNPFKTWAWVGLVGFSLCALTFNLGAAHFRDAVPVNFPNPENDCYITVGGFEVEETEIEAEQSAGQEAVCLLTNQGIRLAEFESYGFFLLGMAFILIGVIHWGHIFPGYPGYLKAKRHCVAARKPLHDQRDATGKRIRDVYDQAVRELQHPFMEDHKTASAIIRQLNNKFNDMEAYATEVARRCRRALDVYRTSNRLAREDISHIPEHWEREWNPTWTLPRTLDNLGLCDLEYVEHLRDEEQRNIEAQLDPFYRSMIAKIETLAGSGSAEAETDDSPLTGV
ncbi:MAG: hypothetical protein OXM02_05840 [Bacteroidota bacterium]|nr:hypothetical protein [Bacteroidota bacterium]